MTENPYIEKLRAMKPRFAEMNIKRLRVFGSQARGDARPDSDVDLLVDFVEGPTLMTIARTQNMLEDELGADVDVCMENCLVPELKDRILREAVDV